MMTILSLCDRTGEWPRPYREAGYDVISLDLQRGEDVRLLRITDLPPVRGILAAPPCTEFASSGARWWASKGDQALLEGLSVVDACLRVVHVLAPLWWALENPVGRLRDYIGPPTYAFDPCDYGDPYTKRTQLWGRFNAPRLAPVEPSQGSKMHLLSPSADRADLRSVTPPGFARAFFASNP
jgi:hypothetical protein